jgi:hypothetical protein
MEVQILSTTVTSQGTNTSIQFLSHIARAVKTNANNPTVAATAPTKTTGAVIRRFALPAHSIILS